jgi:hypothetical protein
MKYSALIAAALLTGGGLAVGTASPASATDPITRNAVGTYSAEYPWATNTWVVTPCANNANQCVHVVEYGPGDTERKYPGWSADAYWQVGWWIMLRVPITDSITCEDGSKHSLPMNYAWDAATGKGVRSYYEPGLCGDAYSGANELQLTKIGPAADT